MRCISFLTILYLFTLAFPCIATESATKAETSQSVVKIDLNNLKTVTKGTKHFVITSNLPMPFIDAILAICETSLDGYQKLFGWDIAPRDAENRIRVYVNIVPGSETSLWVQPDRTPVEIHWTSKSGFALNAPILGGAHNVFGYAHELGHVVMMFDDGDFGQGFADYTGSEVVDFVVARHKDKTWPRPYNYVKWDGSGRLKSWAEDKDTETGSENAAAVLLYEIAQKHGRKAIGDAVARLKTGKKGIEHPTPSNPHFIVYRVQDLRQALIDITGDTAVGALFDAKGFPLPVLEPDMPHPTGQTVSLPTTRPDKDS